MKYRKKPLVIEAKQFSYKFDGHGKWDVSYSIEGVRPAKTFIEKAKDWWNGYPSFYVDTLEGTSYALKNGDYIIKGVKGEFYPCKPDIFEMTYEPIKEGLDE